MEQNICVLNNTILGYWIRYFVQRFISQRASGRLVIDKITRDIRFYSIRSSLVLFTGDDDDDWCFMATFAHMVG